MRFLAAVLLSSLTFPAAAGSPEPAVTRIGEVVWKGTPDALLFTPGARPFDLSPDGRGFLYLQGAPWPRVMMQALPAAPGAPAPEPVVLGTAPPFGDRPPRFDHQGRNVFFTADLSAASRKPARVRAGGNGEAKAAAGAAEPVSLAVVRANTAGLQAERLLPAPGQAPDEFAVFLDLHPGGRTILVGTGRGLAATQISTGDFSLAVSELTFSDSGAPLVPPRPLSFAVNGVAPVRYSWDGTTIYYGGGPAAGGPSPSFRYLRRSGLIEPAGFYQERLGRLAGDVEVIFQAVPHPGCFGWDGFPLCLLSRAPGGPAVPLEVPAALLSPLPLLPISARGDRILLAGGPEDRLQLAVARWDSAAFEGALAAAARAPHPAAVAPVLTAGFGGEEVCARAEDARAGGLLREIRSSLAPGPVAPLVAIRARWTERLSSAPATAWRVEATQTASGQIWVERTEVGGPAGKAPAREVVASDGKESWALDDRGETILLSVADLLQRVARAAPLPLLADPAGFGSLGLAFGFLGEAGEGPAQGEDAGRLRLRLKLEAMDGYRAEVIVAASGGQVLPARIESPLLFPRERIRRGLGVVKEKASVSFEDYRLEGGRRVPGRIRFDDGLNPSELVLEEVEFNLSVAGKLFRQR